MRRLLLSLTIFLTVFISESYAQVKISGFTNIPLGSWSGSGDLSGQNSLCVFNSATANYRVRARGGGAGFSFELTGSGSDLEYEVSFREASGSFVPLTANSYENFTGADTSDVTCNGVPNAYMQVKVTAAELSTVPSGSFSGTLTVLLETR